VVVERAAGALPSEREWWLILVGQGIVNNSNQGVSTIQVPTNPYFIGKKMAFQSLAGTLSAGLYWTPATDAFVNW
jgi:hypothetical protein